MFRLLISVSGVGPKVALGMLSRAPAGDIAAYLRTGDEKALTRLPGIGKKSAARLVVELGQRVPEGGPPGGGATAGVAGGRVPAAGRSAGRAGRHGPGAGPGRAGPGCGPGGDDPAVAEDLEAWVRAACARSSPKTAGRPTKGRPVERTEVDRSRRPAGRRRPGPQSEAEAAGGLRRAGEDQGEPADLHPGRPAAGRGAGSRAAARPAGAGQDHACHADGARDGGAAPHHQRAGLHQQRRADRPAERADGPARDLHRRDPPAGPGHRGAPLPGHGGLAGRADHRQGAQRPALQPAARALHADRRHHARRADHAGPAQPVRHRLPSGFLSARGAGDHRHPQCRASWASASNEAAPWRSPAAAAAPRAPPTACCAACATTPRSTGTR